jgi:hypothetical protein
MPAAIESEQQRVGGSIVLRLNFAVGAVLALASTDIRCVLAAFNYSVAGSTYTQNFDGLASSDIGHDWVNDATPTLAGWHLFRVRSNSDSTPIAFSAYDASDGSADNGRFYSFGTNSERALGGLGAGFFGYPPSDSAGGLSVNQIAGWIAMGITNGTGTELAQINVGFDGEQWRDAGDNEPPYAQTMVLQYGFGASFATVGTWTTPGGDFDWTSPVFTLTAGAIDGNSAGRVADRGGTITGLAWQPGEVLWLRWIERNDPVFDHAMAIDNFSFSAGAAAVPEAGTAAVFALVSIFLIAAGKVLKRCGV